MRPLRLSAFIVGPQGRAAFFYSAAPSPEYRQSIEKRIQARMRKHRSMIVLQLIFVITIIAKNEAGVNIISESFRNV
jgi:uncharacterized protein (DUF1697 family)